MDRKPVTVRSYANIAIIKYWEKKRKEMVPATSSISYFGKHVYRDDLVASTDGCDCWCLLYQWSASEWGWACQDEQNHQPLPSRRWGICPYRYPKCMPTAGLSSSYGLSALVRLAMLISSLVLNRDSWRRKLSLPQVLPLVVLWTVRCLGQG